MKCVAMNQGAIVQYLVWGTDPEGWTRDIGRATIFVVTYDHDTGGIVATPPLPKGHYLDLIPVTIKPKE